MSEWTAYYDHHETRPPRGQLGQAVAAVDTAGSGDRQATDLGFGQGTETLALLEQGWRVLAVDADPEAERRLRARVPAEAEERLSVVTASFGEVELPPSDLIWSGLALPFCPPEDFDVVWRRIRDALRPGGVLAMDLFGPNHAWAARGTVHARGDVDRMLAGLDVLVLDERDQPNPTVSAGVIRWHAFFVLARRPR